MSELIMVAGASLLAVAAYDMIKTTLIITSGGGPITQAIGNGIWRLVLWRNRIRPSTAFLSRAIWFILVAMFTTWTLLLVVGWGLIFNANPYAIVDTATGEVGDFWSRLYFAGYVLITLGIGDYRPLGPFYQMLTVFASINGFFVITLVVAYLSPLVNAAVEKRQLAATILALGDTPDEIVRNVWDDDAYHLLDAYLASLTPMVLQHSQRHLAYPILHFFVSRQRGAADAIALAVLDEALTILQYGLQREHRPSELPIRMLRRATSDYLDKLSTAYLKPADEAPRAPSLEALRSSGVPVVSDEEFRESLGDLGSRRCLLVSHVQNNGWSWEDVHRIRVHREDEVEDG